VASEKNGVGKAVTGGMLRRNAIPAAMDHGHTCVGADGLECDLDLGVLAAFAVHADRDLMPLQGIGEVVAGELATLVGIENLGAAVVDERFLERLDTELGTERVRSRHASTARLTQSMMTTK
jgi:hypothetical protein